MIGRWIFAGALAGAAAGIGAWLAREPVEARSPSSLIVAPQADTELDASPLIRPPTSTDATASGRAVLRTVAGTAGPDPDMGVVGYGRVVDGENTPVQGAEPLLEDSKARLLRANAGPDGSWSLPGLVPGQFDLRVTVDGYLPHAEQVAVPAIRGWRHDVRLERAPTLPVRFEDAEGEALEVRRFGGDGLARYLGVAATLQAPGARIPRVLGRVVRDSEAGRFDSRAESGIPADLGPRYQGLLRLNAAPPVWVSAVMRDVVLESRKISGDEDELVFVVDEAALTAICGEVRVRLVERESGAPIIERVYLGHPSGGLRVQPRVEDGTLVFENVPPGTLNLISNRGQWEWLERSVDVLPRGVVDLGTIELGRRQPFQVRLVDSEGAPISENASLNVVRPELAGGPADLGLRVSVRVNAQGIAEVNHLAPGLTLVRAGGRAGLALVGRLVDTRQETEVELVVPPGVEVVFRHDDSASTGVVWVLENAQGVPLLSRYLRRQTFLHPGTYVLLGLEGERRVERVEFTVGAERLVVRYGGR